MDGGDNHTVLSERLIIRERIGPHQTFAKLDDVDGGRIVRGSTRLCHSTPCGLFVRQTQPKAGIFTPECRQKCINPRELRARQRGRAQFSQQAADPRRRQYCLTARMQPYGNG
ncbi:hypothetical protein D3C86_864170 [compost metagenome]